MTVQSLEANHFVHSSRIVSFLYPAFCFLFFPLFYPGCFVNLVLPAALYSYLNQSHTQDSAHSGSTSFSSCPSGASTVCSIHVPYNPSLPHLAYLSPCASLSTLVIILYLVVSRLTFTLHAAFIRSTPSLAASPSRLHYTTPLLRVRRIVADGMLLGWTHLPLTLALNTALAHIARSRHCTDPLHTHSIFAPTPPSTLSLSTVCLPLP